jgi:hypothetical protein
MKGRVYKRGKSWYYRFDIEPDPLTGKRRQMNGSGYRTEREAWKACRDAMAEHEKGRLVSSSRRKVGEALDEWLTRIEHSIKPSMAQNWRNYAAYYVVPYIGSRDVREIDGPSVMRCTPSCSPRDALRPSGRSGRLRKPFTCVGSPTTAGRCRVGRTATTRCGATASTPSTTR